MLTFFIFDLLFLSLRNPKVLTKRIKMVGIMIYISDLINNSCILKVKLVK